MGLRSTAVVAGVVFILACAVAGFAWTNGAAGRPFRSAAVPSATNGDALGAAATGNRGSAADGPWSNVQTPGHNVKARGSASVADASVMPRPAGTVRTFPVDTYYTEYAEQVDGFGCGGLATSAPGCDATVRGEAKFTGSVAGNERFTCSTDAAHALTPEGHLTYTCVGYFTGSIRGCGSGSFIFDNPNGYIDLSKYDPQTNTSPAYNDWSYRRGSGTGNLQNLVSGSGVNHWTEHFDGEVDSSKYSGTGHFTGTISCYV